MDLRLIGWLSGGIVFGFALGGFAPRRQLHVLEQEHAALAERLSRMERPNPLSVFLPRLGEPMPRGDSTPVTPPANGTDGTRTAAKPAGSLTGADAGERPAAQAPGGTVAVIGGQTPRLAATDGARPAGPSDATAANTDSAQPEPPRKRDNADDGAPRRRGRPRLEDFDRIASVQRARMAASRAALIAQAGLNDEQVAQVDATVTRMNDRLVGYGEEVISQMAAEEPPSPAQALGLGHDVSGVLFEGQQEIDRIVGAASGDVEPEAMEIWNYVDVEQWRPFVDTQLARQPQGAGGRAGASPTTGPVSGAGGSER